MRRGKRVGQRASVAVAGAALLAGGLIAGTSGAPASTSAVRGVVVHPLISRMVRLGDATAPPTTAECLAHTEGRCYGPTQIETAYDEQPLFEQGVNGTGETIVVVDSFGAPDIRTDLAHFDAAFGLQTPPKLTIMPYGPVPAFDPHTSTMTGWAGETSLDVEYAHATAPGANILLVETATPETVGVTGFPTMVNAENYVIDHHLGQVITQSFGASEQTFKSPLTIGPLRTAYVNAQFHGVTVLAAAGDTGAAGAKTATGATYFPDAVVGWPASDPLVTGVGGTQLTLSTAGTQVAPQQVWNTSTAAGGPDAGGGGYSDVFTRPSYQNSVSSVVGSRRGVPDVSMSGSCAGYVDVYITGIGTGGGWYGICGTSEASPLFSGIVALADQEAHHSVGLINPALYQMKSENASGIVDVTQGTNSTFFTTPTTGKTVNIAGYSASAGYNMATGVGTVDAATFVPELAATVNPLTSLATWYWMSPFFMPTP